MKVRGLRALARAEGRLGLHDRSRPRLERALELFTGLGDAVGRADTHRSLGWESEQLGDLPGALRHNQLALELFRSAGLRAAQASVLNSVGWYHALLGEHRQALSHCFEALTMLQDLGDRYGQAGTWDSVAYAYQHLGRHPHALLGYRNALSLYRELGVPYPEAETLTRLGDTHLAMGNHTSARDSWRAALVLLTALGHPDAEQVRARLRERRTTRLSMNARERPDRADARTAETPGPHRRPDRADTGDPQGRAWTSRISSVRALGPTSHLGSPHDRLGDVTRHRTGPSSLPAAGHDRRRVPAPGTARPGLRLGDTGWHPGVPGPRRPGVPRSGPA
ncbi:tetratricopeptide repeat protein [Streptomyces mirabilis]|nr:tetratricopeptide repeat protein [Streptomyces mirabilis]